LIDSIHSDAWLIRYEKFVVSMICIRLDSIYCIFRRVASSEVVIFTPRLDVLPSYIIISLLFSPRILCKWWKGTRSTLYCHADVLLPWQVVLIPCQRPRDREHYLKYSPSAGHLRGGHQWWAGVPVLKVQEIANHMAKHLEGKTSLLWETPKQCQWKNFRKSLSYQKEDRNQPMADV